jgi:hypothetical protein
VATTTATGRYYRSKTCLNDKSKQPREPNDDAFKSIAVVTQIIGQAIEEGLMERKRERDEDAEKELREKIGEF